MNIWYYISKAIFFSILLTFSCSTGKETVTENEDVEEDRYEMTNPADKMNAPLRAKVAEKKNEDSSEQITCFVELKDKIDSNLRAQIEEHGVSVAGGFERIITVRGDYNDLLRLAEMEEVVRMELSLERPGN